MTRDLTIKSPECLVQIVQPVVIKLKPIKPSGAFVDLLTTGFLIE